MDDDEKQVERTVIKADPGWAIARWIPEEEDFPGAIDEDPIIAWSIERRSSQYHQSAGFPPEARRVHHDIVPITVEGDGEALGNQWAIKRPDDLYVVVEVVGPVTREKIIEYFKQG